MVTKTTHFPTVKHGEPSVERGDAITWALKSSFFGGGPLTACVVTFPELDQDADVFPDEFETAVRNFLMLPDGWLENCSPHLWEYFRDIIDLIGEEDVDPIDADDDILTKIELDTEIVVRWDCDEAEPNGSGLFDE